MNIPLLHCVVPVQIGVELVPVDLAVAVQVQLLGQGQQAVLVGGLVLKLRGVIRIQC